MQPVLQQQARDSEEREIVTEATQSGGETPTDLERVLGSACIAQKRVQGIRQHCPEYDNKLLLRYFS